MAQFQYRALRFPVTENETDLTALDELVNADREGHAKKWEVDSMHTADGALVVVVKRDVQKYSTASF